MTVLSCHCENAPLILKLLWCIAGVRHRAVSHTRAGIPNQQGVRAIQQVHEQREDCRLLRWYVGEERRAGVKDELSAHRCWHARSNPRARTHKSPQPEEHQTLYSRWVRQNAWATGYVNLRLLKGIVFYWQSDYGVPYALCRVHTGSRKSWMFFNLWFHSSTIECSWICIECSWIFLILLLKIYMKIEK